jgi:hypothetical protein
MKAIRSLKKPQRVKTLIACFCLLLTMGENASARGISCMVFDEFSDLNCEDLQARLDAYSARLYDAPTAQGYIVVYEGRYRNGRNPRRGELRAKAARIKDYLVNYRGLKSERAVIIDGGYRESFTVELYLCPPGVPATAIAHPVETSQSKDIKFRRGRIKKSEYKWSCL